MAVKLFCNKYKKTKIIKNKKKLLNEHKRNTSEYLRKIIIKFTTTTNDNIYNTVKYSVNIYV